MLAASRLDDDIIEFVLSARGKGETVMRVKLLSSAAGLIALVVLVSCGQPEPSQPEPTATSFPGPTPTRTAPPAATPTPDSNLTPSPSPVATRRTSSEAEERYANGVALGEQARWEEAISEFDEAIRLDPRYARAYLYRGGSYFSLGQFERAIQDYDEAVRLNPRLAEAYVGRGVAYILLGRDSEAQQDADRAVELGFDPAVLKRVLDEAKEHR